MLDVKRDYIHWTWQMQENSLQVPFPPKLQVRQEGIVIVWIRKKCSVWKLLQICRWHIIFKMYGSHPAKMGVVVTPVIILILIVWSHVWGQNL